MFQFIIEMTSPWTPCDGIGSLVPIKIVHYFEHRGPGFRDSFYVVDIP